MDWSRIFFELAIELGVLALFAGVYLVLKKFEDRLPFSLSEPESLSKVTAFFIVVLMLIMIGMSVGVILDSIRNFK